MAKTREKNIVSAWQNMAGQELITENGEAFEVIYPGRPNFRQGADLLDAVIRTQEGVVKGDIEVHAKSSEWQAHRHDDDPGYNSVILHVVLQRDTDVFTVRQNGNNVPILVLEKFCFCQLGVSEENGQLPCRGLASQQSEVLAHILGAAGEVRFRDRAERFHRELGHEKVEQVFYGVVMGALGYTRNKEPFQKLARGLRWEALMGLITESSSDILDTLQALLFGSAGLLPSQRSRDTATDDYVARVEDFWANSSHHQLLRINDWQFGGIRPNNHLVRRLAAATHLIIRFGERGLANEFVDLIRSGSAPRELEKALMVDADGYWVNHFDFGSEMFPHPTLLGAERVGIIVVNVVLPFIFAAAPSLAQRALELYRHYRRLAGNALDRHMVSQLRIDDKTVNSACRQQGLIHLYRVFCTQGRCRECPLAGAGEDYLRKSLSCASA